MSRHQIWLPTAFGDVGLVPTAGWQNKNRGIGSGLQRSNEIEAVSAAPVDVSGSLN